MHASRASTRTTFWYCNLYSWNPLPLVATSSLLRTIYIRGIFWKSVFFLFFLGLFLYGKCEGCWRTIKTWLWSTLFLTPWTLYCWKWRSLMHYTSVKHCGDAELLEASRQRVSTILMFVNTNVQMQKHILSLSYHPRKRIWFPVTIPADILQWFEETRFKKQTKKSFL